MCGLAAVIRWDNTDALAIARSMMQRGLHRGPDGSGSQHVYRSGSLDVALAHARLAILGRGEQGAQPFTMGSVTLIFNGEIYNYASLREELLALGQGVLGASDTEVLASAWERWGPSCLSRLDGMFSIVAWDARACRFYAARDAFAIKPLHMLHTSAGLAFASEIKQFRAIPEWRPEVDQEMLGAFLALGLHDTDPVRTFFRGVERVEPGTWIEVPMEGCVAGQPRIQRFAHAGAVPEASIRNRREAVGALREQVLASVRDHLVSEVPLGSCASGGTDSSILVASATRHLGRGLDLFHAHTAGGGLDELPFVRSLALQTGSRVHVVEITPDSVRDAFEEVVVTQDEPFSDASVIAQWLLMQRARREGIPVLLDGQGADEMFMGYSKYQFHHLQDLLQCGRLLPLALHLVRLLASGEHDGLRLWRKMQRYLPRALRASLASPFPDCGPGPRSAWDSWRASRPSADVVARQDVTQWSLPLLLRYEDRNSMAHGVETRVPYVSWRIMRVARSIEPAVHVAGGRVKSALREAFAGDLPIEISRRRRRLGFVTAWDAWTARGGPLEGWMQERAPADFALVGGGQFTVPAVWNRVSLRRPGVAKDVMLRWRVAGEWIARWS